MVAGGFGVVAAKIQLRLHARRVGKIGHVLEHGAIVGADRSDMSQEAGREGGRVGKTQEAGDMGHLGRLLGQVVGLAVVHHLDAVFDLTKEPIGVLKLGAGFGG